MMIKSFRMQIFLHLLLLFVLVFILTFTIKHYFFVSILCALLIIILLIHFFKYIDRIILTISNFLNNLSRSDVNQVFDLSELGTTFNELTKSANKIKDYLYQSKIEREEKLYYLNTLIEHLDIGIIAYDPTGKIELMNQYAKQLFQISNGTMIDDLSDTLNPMISFIQNMQENSKQILKLNDWENKTLSIHSCLMQFKDKSLRLITFKDIRSEMEEQEIDSWQKLIRVLTHEIMNSITPITSLASTISALMNATESESEFSEDIRNAITTIHKRSSGLLSFVDSFRSLVKIPEPHLTHVSIGSLFKHLSQLIENRLNEHNVKLQISIQMNYSSTIISDDSLLQQALINLLYNAIDAVNESSNKLIYLSAWQEENYTIISVKDSGVGIDNQNLDNIFIPFFTTKKNGNGIGLSMVKQIISKLKGTISVSSSPNQGCQFDIRLRNRYYIQ